MMMSLEDRDRHSVCVLSTCFRLIEDIIGFATLLGLILLLEYASIQAGRCKSSWLLQDDVV